MRTVSAITARPALAGGAVELAWTNPDPAEFAPQGFAGLRILRRPRAHPERPDDGEVVYDGPPVVSLVDAGLAPGSFHYYRIWTRDGGGTLRDGAESLAHGFAAGLSGTAERLHALLPAIHRRLDRPLGPSERALLTEAQRAALDALPKGIAGRGQLERFALALFRPFDLVRAAAEALPLLRDVDRAPPDALAALAESLGWALDETLPLARRRNDARFAPEVLRRNGSVEGVATLVRRYTGWRVDLMERHARLWRTQAPPRAAVRALALRGGTWRGALDAAPLLGLPEAAASGAPGLPAALVTAWPEPFALAAGAVLRLEVGSAAPFAIRFAAEDFAEVGAATAREVANAVSALAPEIAAAAEPDGRLRLATAETGPVAALRAVFERGSPLSPRTAPAGRLAAAEAGPDRAEVLLFETADPLDAVARRAAQDRLRGLPPAGPALPFVPEPPPAAAPTRPAPTRSASRLLYAVRRGGRWLDARALLGDDAPPAARPAAARLGDGRLLLGWLAEPFGREARVALRLATLAAPRRARLALGHPGPWSLAPGARLVLRVRRGRGAPVDAGLVLAASDFADPAAVTQAELLSVLGLRLGAVAAEARPDGGIDLVSLAAGSAESLEIDLEASCAAAALGVDPARAFAAGEDGAGLALAPAPAAPLPPGLADPALAEDGAGGAWLFAVQAADPGRPLLAARFSGGVWGAVETLAGDAAEPAARLASDGRLHLFFARRDPTRPGEDRWSIRRRAFDPAVPGWGPEEAVTEQPVGGRAADREPAPGPEAGGAFPLHLTSDRAGGTAIHRLDVPIAGPPAGAPVAILPGADRDSAPLPLVGPDGAPELLFRSDAAEPPVRPPRLAAQGVASRREDALGLVPHAAGATTADLSHAARLGQVGRRDDRLAYTPQRPIASLGLRRRPEGPRLAEPDPGPEEQLTRETVTAYIRRAAASAPLTAERRTRLAGVLERYRPINLRLVLAVAPARTVEDVYGPDRDIEERWEDRGPLVEHVGPYEERFAAAAPDLRFLTTNDPDRVTADPADLASLRNRLFFPPLV